MVNDEGAADDELPLAVVPQALNSNISAATKSVSDLFSIKLLLNDEIKHNGNHATYDSY
jgi:hypothetical protein